MELIVAGVLIVGVMALISYGVMWDRDAKDEARLRGKVPPTTAERPPLQTIPVRRRHTRLIERQITFSTGGIVAIVFLVLVNLGAFVIFIADSSAIRQAAIGVAWIAINQVCVMCVMIGSRRRYWLLQPDEEEGP